MHRSMRRHVEVRLASIGRRSVLASPTATDAQGSMHLQLEASARSTNTAVRMTLIGKRTGTLRRYSNLPYIPGIDTMRYMQSWSNILLNLDKTTTQTLVPVDQRGLHRSGQIRVGPACRAGTEFAQWTRHSHRFQPSRTRIEFHSTL